jgi:hypothetical protein
VRLGMKVVVSITSFYSVDFLLLATKVSPILKLFEVSDPRRKSIEQKPIGLWFGVELIAPKGSTPANRIG